MTTIRPVVLRIALAAAAGILILQGACASRKILAWPGLEFPGSEDVETSNLHNLARMFKDAAAHPGTDYYFVVVGDSRNMVRSFDLTAFNQVAKHILTARDPKTGASLVDKIRFVIHSGDLLYEGADGEQWDNLRRAFSQKDFAPDNYPYLKMLFRRTPLFPILGNHEVMNLKIAAQSRFRDLASFPEGVEWFKEFFNWDGFIARPEILYPVPADLPAEVLAGALKRLGESPDSGLLRDSYRRGADGRFHLALYEGLPAGKIPDRAARRTAAAALAPVFRKLGYATLPVLSPDNLIAYAFEVDGLVFLLLDSMARGWQYPGFAGMKAIRFPAKDDRHKLHLFSTDEDNPQFGFYREVAAWVRDQGKSLIPIMHHSPFNNVHSIDAPGMEFNYRLALGLGHEGDTTFFDDLLFFNGPGEPSPRMPVIITSCSHLFGRFRFIRRTEGRPDSPVDWFVTGGGGAELETESDDRILQETAAAYNRRLGAATGGPRRSIEIRDNQTRFEYHYLLVHAAGSEILDIQPVFIPKEDVVLKKGTDRFQVKFNQSFHLRPLSMSQTLTLDVGSWGLEGVSPMLSFVTWDPAIGVGYMYYNSGDQAVGVEEYAGIFEVSPFKFKLRFPQSKEVVLHLPGLQFINGVGAHARTLLTMGLEAPLLFNLFGVQRRLGFGFKYALPLRLSDTHDPEFAAGLRWQLFLNYSFQF